MQKIISFGSKGQYANEFWLEKYMRDEKILFLEHLRSVYDHCHDHLLEQGRKRDQGITFYIVLLAFILTNKDKVEQVFGGESTFIFINGGLVIIGWIVLCFLADLRSWHTQYLGSIYTLNWIFANESKFDSVDDIKNQMKMIMTATLNTQNVPSFSKHPIRWCRYWMSGLWKSTDDKVYTGMIVLTATPLMGILNRIEYTKNYVCQWFILYLLVSIIIFEYYAKKKVAEGEKYNTWILSFDYNSRLK